MSRIVLDLPEEFSEAMGATPELAADEVRFAAAAKLYELRRLSSGAAAALAGVPRTVFLARLADYDVATFDLSEEELRRDNANA